MSFTFVLMSYRLIAVKIQKHNGNMCHGKHIFIYSPVSHGTFASNLAMFKTNIIGTIITDTCLHIRV